MLSSRLKPLYDLCQNSINFSESWSDECEHVFQTSKEWLTSDSVLTHYDPKQTIYVICDASSRGVGCVLSHSIDNTEKPVLFASSSLSKAKKKYSNLERKALAIIFALKKFHKYLYGRRFVLVTDHQPLQFIFGKNKSIPTSAAARITRWAIMLSGYQYDIVYKKGMLIGNADGLSRLPCKNLTGVSDFLYSFNMINKVPLNAFDIAREISRDLVLLKVKDYTISGWPQHVSDENLKPYFKKRNELSVEQNCILLGNKVIIPKYLQKEVLDLFHEQHNGIVRSKMLMRSYCWWPNMTLDIEKYVSTCGICEQCQNFTNSRNLTAWPTALFNFFRVHVDFFYKNKFTFLIKNLDQKSKWVDVKLMTAGTAALETISKLRDFFSVFGLPAELVSDNGPPFSSNDFVMFCQANGIKPIKSPPYHPQSNGQQNGMFKRSKQVWRKPCLGRKIILSQKMLCVTSYKVFYLIIV